MPTVLKEERNVINSSSESCNGKVKLELSSLSLTISFSLSLHFFIHFNFKFLAVTTTANYVSKNFSPFNLQFRSFYSSMIKFLIFDLTYIFCLHFIFYIVLIRNICPFLWIRHWRENYIMKYLHNRSNYSFHHSIATFVFIT